MSEPDFPYNKKPGDIPVRSPKSEKVLPAPKEQPQLISAKPPMPILGINSSNICQACGRIFITEEDLKIHIRKNH